MKLALFDLNGVIADASHRLEGSTYSADPRKVIQDAVYPDGRAQLKAMQEQDWVISYITGRPLFLRGVSLEWLKNNDLPNAELIQRPMHPPMSSVEFKVEIVQEFLGNPDWSEVTIFDNDPAVIDGVTEVAGPESAFLCTWSHRALAGAETT